MAWDTKTSSCCGNAVQISVQAFWSECVFLDDDDDDARLIQVHRMPGLSLVDVPVVVRTKIGS